MGSLSSQQVSQYEDLGILFPIEVISQTEAAAYLKSYQDVEALCGRKPRAVELTQFHVHFRWAYELVTRPAILDAVESVLGEDILAWSSSFFPKAPRDPSYVSWHQDGTYWGLDSTKVTTAWVALTDSSQDNGCMRVAPGTHLQPLLPHVETRAEDNLLSRGQEVAADVKEEDALDVVLAPGEMSLHHVNIIHGSNANRSDRPRVGFAIRFTTPEVTPDPLTAHGMLVRGKDRYGHFRLFDPPKKRPLKEAFEAQRKDAREQYEALQSTKGQFENPRV